MRIEATDIAARKTERADPNAWPINAPLMFKLKGAIHLSNASKLRPCDLKHRKTDAGLKARAIPLTTH